MDRSPEHVYTPSELNREIKLHLETGFPRIVVEAEISNLARPPSGHLYFSLKDEKAQIRCAMFRSAASRMTMAIENGAKVLARGRISLYEPRGDYQFIIESMEDAGEGLLQRRFEELKKKLEAEGLFDPALKQKLPPYPARIGLVTSPSGAAVRDLLHVMGRRWPIARIRLYPVTVQGTTAPADIRAAIEAANHHGWADILIVGRGGGSLEDLAAFNDEAVARSVFASAIPVVAAVGHETDFSICDFVADLRAPTPSAAAELATPDQAAMIEVLARSQRQLTQRIRNRLQREMQRLDHAMHRLQQRHPATRLKEQARRVGELGSALVRALDRELQNRSIRVEAIGKRLRAQHPGRKLVELGSRLTALRQAMTRLSRNAVQARQQKLGDLARMLNAVSPLEIIGRGYAVLTGGDTEEVVSSVSQVAPGDRVSARLKDGELDCTVDAIR